MVRLTDFLTKKQIALAMELKTAKQIHDKVIQPNINTINRLLGQENDAMYLAYAVEYALTHNKTH